MSKTLFYNAHFYNMKDEHSFYDAVLCEDGKIIKLYENNSHFLSLYIDAKKVNLNGSYVYPGFVDAHTHSFEGGLYEKSAKLNKCKSISDTLDIINSTKPISKMIFASGYDENNIKEKRFPTKKELDKISSNTPIIIRRIDGHSCVINTPAVKMLDKKDISQIDVYTAELNDLIAHTFHQNLTNDDIINCYLTAQQIAIENGHTGIHTMIGDANNSYLHFEIIADKIDNFLIDYSIYPQCFNIAIVKRIYEKYPKLFRRIGGCILADGSLGSHTASLKQPYKDRNDSYGKLYKTQEFWNNFFNKASEQNLQVAVHCIGDMAIKQITDAIINAKNYSLRHQIIHNELTPNYLIKNIKRCGAIAVMQPMFDKLWGGEGNFYSKVIGKRIKKMNRFKSLTENGIIVAGSSDWYITELSALKGIEAAINHHNQSEKLSNFEAVKLYTTNAHYLNFQENYKGLIQENYQADFVCVNNNLFQNKNLKKTNIMFTIKNAKVIYENKDY